MQSFALRAAANVGFRWTVDLSAWAAVGVSLAPAVIRMQARSPEAAVSDPPAIEFATGGANAIVFDPLTGLAVISAPGAAMAALLGRYVLDCRAEFGASEEPLFAGTLDVRRGVTATSPTSGAPAGDTVYLAAHPFGPAPAPAPIANAVKAAQDAARSALTRAFIYGGS